MVTFEKFFDSALKARLVKFFIYNPEGVFEQIDITRRLKLKTGSAKKYLDALVNDGFLKSRSIKSKKSYSIDPKCPYLRELKALLLEFSAASHEKLLADVKKIGVVKLVVIGGVFLNTDRSRVDIFIVANNVKEQKLNKFLKDLEAEVGKEISYSLVSLEDFKYRMDMFDRFVRDILEFPHEKLINKLKI